MNETTRRFLQTVSEADADSSDVIPDIEDMADDAFNPSDFDNMPDPAGFNGNDRPEDDTTVDLSVDPGVMETPVQTATRAVTTEPEVQSYDVIGKLDALLEKLDQIDERNRVMEEQLQFICQGIDGAGVLG